MWRKKVIRHKHGYCSENHQGKTIATSGGVLRLMNEAGIYLAGAALRSPRTRKQREL
jgi:hypothetical protein